MSVRYTVFLGKRRLYSLMETLSGLVEDPPPLTRSSAAWLSPGFAAETLAMKILLATETIWDIQDGIRAFPVYRSLEISCYRAVNNAE